MIGKDINDKYDEYYIDSMENDPYDKYDVYYCQTCGAPWEDELAALVCPCHER